MSVDYSAMSDAELLRAAIAEEREHWDAQSDFALGQLYAGTVVGRPDLQAVWDEEMSPDQAEVVFHLTGEGVKGHGTRADKLADFAAGINTATKAIVRDKLQLPSLRRNLIIEGVGPGSVTLTMRADTPLPTDGVHTVPGADGSSPDSVALRTVARIFTTASSDDPAVGAELRTMHKTARQGLARAARAAREARWDIDGTIRQRGYGSDSIALSQEGAAQILEQVHQHQYNTDQNWVAGRIEGFRGSLGRLYLITNATPRPVPISVPDADVLRKVRQLAVDDDTPVWAHVETVTAAGERGERVSRSLLDIRPGGQQAAMIDAEGNPLATP